ncbi:lysophospholipid acyltransferase family protein [Solitalea koreensis]|uniref:lysophospholipid acyltransferase family protein n=1 Tax=Solitalea koreensis TaxID=543615 RepID=UPI00163DA5DB|nr:lysophospholipid acyltransferase family protein [Solitalea koreensis]
MKKIAYYLSLPLLYLIAWLPFPLLYLFSDFLAFILFRVVGYRKQVILLNLKNSFPEKTVDEIEKITRNFYRNFTDMIVESIKMLCISKSEIEKRFTLKNPELINNYHDQGRSIVAIVGHLINWEWGCLVQSISSSKDSIVIYKPLKNKYYNQLVYNMRTQFGAVLVPMKSTLRKLTEYKGKPYILLLAGDQYPGKGEGVYKTSFLNQTTYVHLGTEKTAKMTDSAVVFGDIRRKSRGFYEVTYVSLIDKPQNTAPGEITELHVRYLEKIIRESPDTWLWSHRRWK